MRAPWRLAMLLAAFIFGAWADVFGGAAMHAAELHIGAATISITPEQPVALSGQMHTRISQRVDSPVMASVLVLESLEGSRSLDQAIMVACDLVAIREGLIDDVRAKLKQRLPDVDPQKLFLSATHTHTAPETIEGQYDLPLAGIMRPEAYSQFLTERIVAAIERAWQAPPAGKCRLGTGPCRRRAESARGVAGWPCQNVWTDRGADVCPLRGL